MTSRRILLVLTLGLVVGGCSASNTTGSTTRTSTAGQPVLQALWPAPPDPMARTVAAGLVPETHETLEHHVHAHLDVFLDGVHQTVAPGVGIRIEDPAVHTGPGPSYGGISVPCETPCISPLHTHSPDGVLHTESPVEVDNTLGQFFVEWDVKLDAQCVGEFCAPDKAIAIYVDGTQLTAGTDPAAIALTDRKEIAIVIGTPPADIPRAFPTA